MEEDKLRRLAEVTLDTADKYGGVATIVLRDSKDRVIASTLARPGENIETVFHRVRGVALITALERRVYRLEQLVEHREGKHDCGVTGCPGCEE